MDDVGYREWEKNFSGSKPIVPFGKSTKNLRPHQTYCGVWMEKSTLIMISKEHVLVTLAGAKSVQMDCYWY